MLYDLSHTIATGMMQVRHAPPVEVCRNLSLESGSWVNSQTLRLIGHSGTHLDAPLHVLANTEGIDVLPLDRFIGPGLTLSVTKGPCELIDAADLEAADGGRVREGDIVLLHTGWDRYYGTPAYYDYPSLTLAAADWLLDRRVRLVALDTLSPDLPPERRPPDHFLPVHCRLLGNGVLIGENLTGLGPLAGHRLQVAAVPIKVIDGDGAPARVYAELVD